MAKHEKYRRLVEYDSTSGAVTLTLKIAIKNNGGVAAASYSI